MGRKEREAVVADSVKNIDGKDKTGRKEQEAADASKSIDEKDKAPQKAARKEREPDTVAVRSFRCEKADLFKNIEEYNKLIEAFLQSEVFDRYGRVLAINEQDGEGNNRTVVKTTTIYFTVPPQCQSK